MNVRFEGNNGHDADVTRCLLMTQNEHWWTWTMLAVQIEHCATSTAQTLEPDDKASQEVPLRAAKSGYLSRGTKWHQLSPNGRRRDEDTRKKYLKIALVVFRVIFLLIYPLTSFGRQFGVAWRAGRLFAAGRDLRDLCGAGHLFDHRGKEPWRELQPHLVHHLVERRARGDHGNPGALRQ